MNARFNYVPVTKAMEELCISRYKFYDLVKQGRITIKKIDRRSFVSVDQINQMFEDAPKAA